MKTPDIWKRLAALYAALNRRERLIVALVLVLGPALLIYSFVLEPEMRRVSKAKASLQTLQQNLLDSRRQEAALAEQLKLDPDAAKKAELAALKSSLGGAGERLKKLEVSLVSPEQMNATLERVLARHPNLQLISLKTLAPESVVPPPPKVEGKADAASASRSFDIFRHGMEVRLEGSYGDLYAYLNQLEREEKKLLWGRLHFEVQQHPKATLTLVLYTLSSEKAWLAI